MGTTAEKLQAALNSKNAVKTALEDQGLKPTDEFSTYAGLIGELDNTSDATATEDDILEGAVAYSGGERLTGKAAPGIPIVTTAGTGAAFTATVTGITELTVGRKITIIPHVASTSATATLNVNNLGAKQIRQRLSTNTSSTVAATAAGWLAKGKPVTVMYNGTYWVAELTKPDANNLYGAVPIENGGTGATTAADALANLGLSVTAEELNNMSGSTGNVNEQLTNKADKDEVFITVEDIDSICGENIQVATSSEVTF